MKYHIVALALFASTVGCTPQKEIPVCFLPNVKSHYLERYQEPKTIQVTAHFFEENEGASAFREDGSTLIDNMLEYFNYIFDQKVIFKERETIPTNIEFVLDEALLHEGDCSELDRKIVGEEGFSNSVPFREGTINIYSCFDNVENISPGYAMHGTGRMVVKVYNFGIYAHELGHSLGLLHTYENTAYGPEFVDGSNSSVAGDLIQTTPADSESCVDYEQIVERPDGSPYLQKVVECSKLDLNGDTYLPDHTNIMSRNPGKDDRDTLTQEQTAVIRCYHDLSIEKSVTKRTLRQL
jgi:hypothetical protein